MATTLRIGSRGFDVVVLQVQLNVKNPASLKLQVDGSLGPNTQAVVISFQRQMGLTPDGIVGPLTHAALAKGLTLSTAHHSVTHIAQPTASTCWAASTAMMTHSTVAAVRAKTPTDMIASDGGLRNSSGSDQAVVTGTRYGNIHNLRCHAPMSWSVSALYTALRQSPLMFDMLWNSAEYAQGSGSPGHMIVVSSMVSDNNPTGNGTYLLVLDPWPPNVGKIAWVEYQRWINEVPTRTYRVFNR
ncbi:papain like cysteine protease AvrRpt2 [Nitrosomonas sp. Nm84]|uniref:peptidoglycan-binding protein n=1 Tax=Nitrosomonas sp. Nm84 TaxID=200124 RepID=UPI000D76F33D|nr:peptidoglycan-binding protein [Nitrosomonas sp. Nm84]PXW80875.1 papain like cysteine protease AvrRpt2 [Nitrosomonas sp. Nm84]